MKKFGQVRGRTTARAAAAIALLLLLASFFAGCGETPDRGEKTLRSFFAMDTLMEFTIYGSGKEAPAFSGAADRAVLEIQRLEEEFSAELPGETQNDAGETVKRPENQIERLNASEGNWVEISDELAYQLAKANEVSERSGGALDISVFPIVKAWGFSGKDYRVPREREIEKLLPLVDYTKIRVDGGRALLEPGMSVGLGSVTKGYASDRAREILSQAGVKNAILSLGGNLCAMGERPEGGAWRIGIQDPGSVQENALIIQVRDKFVISSGGYQRYFTEDGKTYHHIIDPSTGRQAQTDGDGNRLRKALVSVTVVSDSGIEGDALSTALFVLGEEKALEYYEDYGGFEAVLITADGRIICTPGISADVQHVRKGYALEVYGGGQ